MKPLRKTNRLQSRGTLSVTVSSQTRIMKRQQNGKCHICDKHIGTDLGNSITEAISAKIDQIVGNKFNVVVNVGDAICKPCLTMFQKMDKLKTNLGSFERTILNLLKKKHGINDNGNAGASSTNVSDMESPPAKLQKLNTSVGTINANSKVDAEATAPFSQPIQSQPVNQFAGSASAIDYDIDDTFEFHETAQPNSISQTQLVRQVNKPTVPSRRPKGFYQCKVCSKTFPSVDERKKHNDEKHGKTFACSECKKIYKLKKCYETHMIIYHNSKNPAKNTRKTGSQSVAVATLNTNIQTEQNTSTFEETEIGRKVHNTEGAVIISHEILTGGRRFNITMENRKDDTAHNIGVENTNKQVDTTHVQQPENNNCNVSSSSDGILSDLGDDDQLKQQQQQPADEEIHTNSEEQPVQSVALLQASDGNVLDVRNASVVTSSSNNEESSNHSNSNGHDNCNTGNSGDEDDSEQSILIGSNKRVEVTVSHDDCVKMGYFNKKMEEMEARLTEKIGNMEARLTEKIGNMLRGR